MGTMGKWGWRNDGDEAMTYETTGTRRRMGWQDDDEAPPSQAQGKYAALST